MKSINWQRPFLIIIFLTGHGHAQDASDLSLDDKASWAKEFLSLANQIAFSDEPTMDKYLVVKNNTRIILENLCNEYLIILPKLMGCVICQYLHYSYGSERYLHYAQRREQLLRLKVMLVDNNFDIKKIINFINTQMYPFAGEFGQNFYMQCALLLSDLLRRWQ